MPRIEEFDNIFEANDGEKRMEGSGSCSSSAVDCPQGLAKVDGNENGNFQLGADSTSSGSDSAMEDEITQQAEDLEYGTTPPRHARRMKDKSRSLKKDQAKKFLAEPGGYSKENKKCIQFYKRERERAYRGKFNLPTAETITKKMVNIHLTSKYRSIRSVPANLNEHAEEIHPAERRRKPPYLKCRSCHDIHGDYDCPTTRLQFLSGVKLQIRLVDGPKGGRRVPKKKSFDELDGPGSWQSDLDQVLWLELKAWHAGRSVAEQDIYLDEERKKVDNILDEIAHFNFPAKLAELKQREESNQAAISNQPLNQSRSPFSSMPENQVFDLSACPVMHSDNDATSPAQFEFSPHDIAHTCSTLQDHITDSVQQKAMQIIIMMLMKLQTAQSLYPTSKNLAQCHPKFIHPRFLTNCETLNLWLNICKELYHKLQVMASLMDIDVSEVKTWNDWIGHGLGLTCVKTRQTYPVRRQSFSSSAKDDTPCSPTNASHHASKRKSFVKETTTSRYRSFVEKNVRRIGLNGLTKRIKSSLHTTLWKARQALEVPKDEHEDMERQHSYGKVTDLVEFLEKTAMEDPSQKTVLSSIALHLEDFQVKDNLTHERGVWSRGFSEMGLPSFLELYLFLAKVAFDIMHETVRYRLDNRPTGDPSHMSIKQLLNECKEVISIAIIGKYYYQDMALSVLTADDKARIDDIDKDIDAFEEDLKALLSIYFEYLQNLFQMLQRLPEASRSLKNTMEDEWQFAKEICPHTKGLEAEAGRTFCVLASDLLSSTARFLESSLDECSSELFEKLDSSSEKVKDIALEACRNHKKLFNEIRERATKALGFTKMLQKDLGIAAEFKVKVDLKEILNLLKISGHAKVDCKNCDVNYEVYTNQQCDQKQILRLLNVTCGFEDPAEADILHNEGYILLLNLCNDGNDDDNDDKSSDKECLWDGQTVNVSPTVDTTIALAYLQVEGLMLISCNSYQLSTQRLILQKELSSAVTLINEQTSSHQTIADALCEFRENAKHLADKIIDSENKISDTLRVINDLQTSDKSLVHHNYVETMHLYFNTGFEYLRELARLLSGRSKDLYTSMMDFSNSWMEFVYKNIERGKGKKPRWATQGLEFIIDACNPRYLAEMEEEAFQEVRKKINGCISYIIGTADSTPSPSGYRSGSPLSMHRVKSLPSGNSAKTNLTDRFHTSMSDSFGPSRGSSDTSAHVGSDSEGTANACDSPLLRLRKSSDESLIHPASTMMPMDRIRNALKKLEKRRNEKLIKKQTIGRISDKKPDLASELVKIKSRRVNFKWHLGNKIGEGQFGKIYSCVNLDTGKRMAMKKIRVNAQDYSSIQDIADEITNIQSLRHESLVEYHGVEIHKDEMLIFMEYCGDGTIADVAKVGLPEQMIRVYTLQIIGAIKFIHQNGIVHRDIKGANIFVSSSGIIKLGDFGSAVRLKDPTQTMHGELSKFKGTAAFMAPEIINTKDDGYGRAADIWSLGCVVIEMTTGKTPWAECDHWYTIIFRVGGGASPAIPESLSEEGKDFLKQCFFTDAESRWTAEKLEDHTFVKVGALPGSNK